ncbi:unnamed protein product [Pieris brassicae]|uniref:Uncharacterized protein n=1 Tax=Pieris brassicae TaxID=7116 RepID=A0A9P0TK06_PIEBR|nr:unnamed protein product [Pieris brassicae]
MRVAQCASLVASGVGRRACDATLMTFCGPFAPSRVSSAARSRCLAPLHDAYRPPLDNANLEGTDLYCCACLVSSDGPLAPRAERSRAPCRVKPPYVVYANTQGKVVGAVGAGSRGGMRIGGHVVAWVIHCLCDGRARTVECGCARCFSSIHCVCLYCPDACPAAGDHAHFICFCVPSIRLPVYVHLDGIVSPRSDGKPHHLREFHSLFEPPSSRLLVHNPSVGSRRSAR